MSIVSSSPGVALIMGDGGIKGGFVAGAANALLTEIPEFKDRLRAMAAASAGVGNVIYYLSFGERHPGKVMWTEVLASSEFIRFGGVADFFGDDPIYDIDHMVDRIFRERFPLDEDAISNASVKFYLPVLDVDTNEVMYISNAESEEFYRDGKRIKVVDYKKYNIYDVIRAASAAPFIFDAAVKMNGVSYMDAAAVEPLALDLPGFDNLKKVVILTKRNPTLLRKLRYLLVSGLFIIAVRPFRKRKLPIDKYIQYALKPFVLDRRLKELREMERSGDAVLIVPTRKIGGLLDNSPATLEATYRHGEEAALAKRAEIIKMLQG